MSHRYKFGIFVVTEKIIGLLCHSGYNLGFLVAYVPFFFFESSILKWLNLLVFNRELQFKRVSRHLLTGF